MPIYEYHCRHCGKSFEDLVRLGTPDEQIECPHCHQRRAHRLLSVFSGQTGQGSRLVASSAAGSCGDGGGFT